MIAAEETAEMKPVKLEIHTDRINRKLDLLLSLSDIIAGSIVIVLSEQEVRNKCSGFRLPGFFAYNNTSYEGCPTGAYR